MQIKFNIYFVQIFILFIYLLLNSNALPQSTTDILDSLVIVGDSLYKVGNFSEAEKIYKNLLKWNDNLVQANLGLGRIAFEQKKWRSAAKYFDKVLKQCPENIEALYYQGICLRESGKFKASLLRSREWNRAERYFEQAIALDSLYRDVFYQFALLKKYRGKYTEAIQLGHTQICLKPDLIDALFGLFKIYQSFIRHKKEEEVIGWLSKQKWDFSRFFIAEKLRREGKLKEADSLLKILINVKTILPKQPLYLARVKIFYQSQQPDSAEYYYWKAVEEIKGKLDAVFIFDELKYIINDRELRNYRSLRSTLQLKNFFHTFWLKRNPFPAEHLNIRLKEHYERLLYAEKYFEYDGFRTWFNNPDKLNYLKYPESYDLNNEFNDMGLIYIRHGEPDDKVITTGEYVPINESWLYYKSSSTPRMIFHFVKENTAQNNWRFSPIIRNAKFLSDRFHFGPDYYDYYNSDPLERMFIEQEIRKNSKKSVKIGLSTDQYKWDETVKQLNLVFDVVTFRDKNKNAEVIVYFAVPTNQFETDIKDTAQILTLKGGIAVFDLKWRDVFVQQNIFKLTQPENTEGVLIDLFKFSVPPDSYRFTFYLKSDQSNLLANYRFNRKIENYNNVSLSISDILLAFLIRPATDSSRFVKSDLFIIPNPGKQFLLKLPLYVYFEIYNLAKNRNKTTSYTVEYRLNLLKGTSKGIFHLLKGFFKKSKSSVSIISEREGYKSSTSEFIVIDASKLEPGLYELSVNVTDNISSLSAQKTVELILR